MSENLHDIDQLFRDAIEGHEEQPAEQVWQAVDAGLDKTKVIHIQRKYNNLKRIAAVLLLLLLSVAGYEIFKNGKPADGSTAGAGKQPAAGAAQKAVPATAATAAEQENTASSAQAAAGTHAGYDAENNSSPKENTKAANAATENNNTGNKGSSTTAAAPGNTKQHSRLPVKENALDTEDLYDDKRSAGRSSKNNTRVKVKRPVPQQYSDDDNGYANDATTNDATTANELPPLQNTKVSTLAQRINKAVVQNETTAANRLSPEVQPAKQKSRRPFRFNIMPYFTPQLFASTALKEEQKFPNQPFTPGGPPPPRTGPGNHKEQYRNEEEVQTAYTAGVQVEIPVGKKWAVQSGISYTQKNISIQPKKIYARPDKDGKVKYVFDCSSGYSYISSKTGSTPVAGDSISVTRSTNTLGYIGVPVAVSYKITPGKKVSIIPTVGTVLNFLTRQKIKTQLVQGAAKEQQTIHKIEGMRSGYVSATAGLALEYDVNKRIAVNIMPSANFALTAINNDAVVRSYPNTFGISGGVKIKF